MNITYLLIKQIQYNAIFKNIFFFLSDFTSLWIHEEDYILKPAHTRAICLAKCHSCHFAQHIAPVCAQFL